MLGAGGREEVVSVTGDIKPLIDDGLNIFVLLCR
jgi:hypothetical protein